MQLLVFVCVRSKETVRDRNCVFSVKKFLANLLSGLRGCDISVEVPKCGLVNDLFDALVTITQ